MGIGMAVGASRDIAVAAGAIIFAWVERSVGHMAIPACLCLFVFRMAVDTCRYVPVVFAVIQREVIVDITMAGSTHFFCSGVFENGVPDRKMRVAVTPKTDAPIPLCVF
jgi:hypothetical protein